MMLLEGDPGFSRGPAFSTMGCQQGGALESHDCPHPSRNAVHPTWIFSVPRRDKRASLYTVSVMRFNSFQLVCRLDVHLDHPGSGATASFSEPHIIGRRIALQPNRACNTLGSRLHRMQDGHILFQSTYRGGINTYKCPLALQRTSPCEWTSCPRQSFPQPLSAAQSLEAPVQMGPVHAHRTHHFFACRERLLKGRR